MPDNYLSYDQLFSKVSANKPGMTQEQFHASMQDPQKASSLFENIKKTPEANTIPGDFKSFVDTYGFNKPLDQKGKVAPKSEEQPAMGYADPNFLAQQTKNMLDQEAKKTQETTDQALMLTGLFKKGDQGVVPLDPHLNVNEALAQKADDAFKGLLKESNAVGKDGADMNLVDTFINSYYGTNDENEKKTWANNIKGIIPNWQPLTDYQYKALQNAKIGMYLNYLNSHADNKLKGEAVESGASFATDPLSAMLMGQAVKSAGGNEIDADAMAYAKATYMGQSAIDNPSHFWASVWGSISDVPFTNLKYRGAADYNERLKQVFEQNGLHAETPGQAKEFNPTTSDKISEGIGNGVGFLLPMVAGGYVGDAIKVTSVGDKLLQSDNALMRVTGKMLNTSFTNTATITYADWRTPLHGIASGITFSAVDASLDKLGIKANNAFGRALSKFMTERSAARFSSAITGTGKGVVTGVLTTGEEKLYDMAKQHIMGSSDFTNEFSKENPDGWANLLPTTKDALANIVTMGIFGLVHGTYDYKSAFDDLKNNGFKNISAQAEEQLQKINDNAPKAEAAANTLMQEKGNPQRAIFPEQQAQPIVKTDDKVNVPRATKEFKDIAKDKPSDTKAFSQDFVNDDEANKFKRQATMRGLNTIEVPMQDEKGEAGKRVIVYDKNHLNIAKRLYELSGKEMSGTITPDEVHEMAALEGQDPKTALKSLAAKAKSPELKEIYENKLKDVVDKTENGFGAYNDVAKLNKDAKTLHDQGHDEQAKRVEDQAEIEARKYGFKVHRDEKGLTIEDADGNTIGTESKFKPENKNELIDKVNSGAPVDEIKEVANKEGLNVSIEPYGEGEERVEVRDETGKTILTENDKIRGINDFVNKDDIKRVVKAMGHTSGVGFKGGISIKDMSYNEVSRGWQDINKGVKSLLSERLLTAVDKMITEDKIPTTVGEFSKNDFLMATENATPGKNSPVNQKPMDSPVKNLKEGSVDKETIERDAQKWTKPEGLYKDMTDEELQAELKKKGLPSKDKSMIQNIIKSRTLDNVSGANEGQKKSKQESVNDLTDKVKRYNSRTERERKNAEGQKLRSEIETSAKELGFTPEMKGTSIEVRNEKGNVVRPKGAGMRSEAEGAKPLEERSDDLKFLFNKLSDKGGINFPRIESQGRLMTPKDIDKAISDIKEGKITNAANDVLNTLEDYVKSGELTIGTEGTGGTGKTNVPIEDYLKFLDEPDVHAAGFFSSNKKKLSPAREAVENLNREHQYRAKSDIDLRQAYSETFNKFMGNPEEMKAELNKRAAEYFGASEEVKDENPKLQTQNLFTAERLAAISDAIRSKEEGGLRDIRNFGEMLSGRKSFFVADDEVHAHNLEEARMVDELKKPRAPMTKGEREATEKAISLNDPVYESIISDIPKDKSAVRETFESAVNSVRHMMFLHNTLPPEIRSQGEKLFRSVVRSLVKEREENNTALHSMLDKENFNFLSKEDKQAISDVLAAGHFKHGKYYSDEELRQGEAQGFTDAAIPKLTDNQIAGYKRVVDIIKKNKDFYKEEGRQRHGYYTKMNPAERQEHDETYRSYLEDNNGYVPLQRHGDHFVIYHGLNPVTGVEERHVEMHEGKDAAEARAKQLSEQSYVHEGQVKKYAGVDDENNRKEGSMPVVKKYDKLNPQDIKDVSHGDIATLEKIKEKFAPSSKEYKNIEAEIDKLKSSKYNPAFMKSNKVLGADTGWDNMMESVKNMGERGIHSLARAKADAEYEQNSKFLNPSRYSEYRKNYDSWHKDLMGGTSGEGGSQVLSNIQYYTQLAMKPLFFAQQIGHNISTVYPMLKNEMRVIEGERKAEAEAKSTKFQGLKEPGESLFMRAWGDAMNLTSHLIGKAGKSGLSDIQKLVFSTVGLAGNVEKTAFKSYDEWTKNTEEGKTFDRMVNRGTVGNTFYNDINGREVSSGLANLSGAATGYVDILTRAHSAITAIHLGKLKGLSGDKLLNYAEDFVDKTKFMYGKTNRIPLMRDIHFGTGETKPEQFASTVSSVLRRQFLMMKQSHLMDNFFNVDMVRHAESPGKTLSELILPRVILGGLKSAVPMGGIAAGYALWANNMAQGKEKLKNVTNFQEQGGKLDAFIRRELINELGKDEGNKWADNAIYGIGATFNADLRSTIDLGSVLRDNMPLGDQLFGVGTTALSGKLPGEFGNLEKGYEWYKIMENRAQNLPGQKTLYTGMGVDIPPTQWDIGTKLLGINTVKNEKYYDAEALKQKYVGANGKGEEPEGGSDKYNLIQEISQATTDNYAEKKDKIEQYLFHPSDETFIAAYGKSLYNKINDYNVGLVKDVYTQYQALDVKQKEGMNLLNLYRSYGLGLTWDDSKWESEPGTDLRMQLGVQKAIEATIRSRKLNPQ